MSSFERQAIPGPGASVPCPGPYLTEPPIGTGQYRDALLQQFDASWSALSQENYRHSLELGRAVAGDMHLRFMRVS